MARETLQNYTGDRPVRILFMRSGGHFAEIDPPDAPMIAPPKGILYLAGMFKNDKSVNTRFLDILANADFKKVVKEKNNPPIYFGMSDHDIIKSVMEYSPDIIAVTSTANYYINETIKLINTVSLNFPSVFIVAGGPDATNDFDVYFERCPGLDVIVMKEGEITFKNLVSLLKESKSWKKLKGIAYRKDGKTIITQEQPYITNLDELQCDYDIIDLEKYFKINRIGYQSRLIFKYPDSHRSIDLVTSRGCVHKCAFCCIHLHMGRCFRAHSAEYVLAEMKMLIEKYNVRNFHFEDDNLLYDRKRFFTVLQGIIANKWKITWDTPNGIRADQVDHEFLDLCRRSGCTYLIFGAESGSKKVHDTILKKNLDIDKIISACKLCYEYEIDTLAFFIFGFPGETKEDLLKTYYFAFELFKKYNTTPIFQLWRPYRNTDMELTIRNTTNVTQQVIYSLHREYRIPYTLFYSKVYEDEEITIPFLSYYFEKYIRDVEKYAFINWLKITKKRPFILLSSVMQITLIYIKAMFTPSSRRSKLRQYLVSPGIMPFSIINKRGKK